MNFLKRLLGMIEGGSALEKAAAKAVLHFATGDIKDGVADTLALILAESQSHPAVATALAQIQAVLAGSGLAHPVATAEPAPAQVQPAVVPAPVTPATA